MNIELSATQNAAAIANVSETGLLLQRHQGVNAKAKPAIHIILMILQTPD
jgi:hypothetical protein